MYHKTHKRPTCSSVLQGCKKQWTFSFHSLKIWLKWYRKKEKNDTGHARLCSVSFFQLSLQEAFFKFVVFQMSQMSAKMFCLLTWVRIKSLTTSPPPPPKGHQMNGVLPEKLHIKLISSVRLWLSPLFFSNARQQVREKPLPEMGEQESQLFIKMKEQRASYSPRTNKWLVETLNSIGKFLFD